MNSVFSELCRATGGEPERDGRVLLICPICGANNEKHLRCSFWSEESGIGERAGWKCFVCDSGGGLHALAKLLHVKRPRQYIAPPRKKRKPAPAWMRNADNLAAAYAAHPGVVRLWQAYKPLSEKAIREAGLGVGTLPRFSSRCQHRRLIVPIRREGKVIGFRARTFECECDDWLTPLGSKMWLYNCENLVPGRITFVLENPIDALLTQERWSVNAVATLGVSNWKDEYTAILVAARPEWTVIGFDNHQPGNGGWQAKWLEGHQLPLKANGKKLFNRLAAAGLRCQLWDWKGAPYGADFGDYFK